MLIKTPINQWPLQSYSVTLSQLILKQNDQTPGNAIIILCVIIIFFFRVKKTKPKLLIDHRQGKNKNIKCTWLTCCVSDSLQEI